MWWCLCVVWCVFVHKEMIVWRMYTSTTHATHTPNTQCSNVESCTSAALLATNWNVATGLWLRHCMCIVCVLLLYCVYYYCIVLCVCCDYTVYAPPPKHHPTTIHTTHPTHPNTQHRCVRTSHPQTQKAHILHTPRNPTCQWCVAWHVFRLCAVFRRVGLLLLLQPCGVSV